MYSAMISDLSGAVYVCCDQESASIPTNPMNLDYKTVLDKVIEEGAACWDGDIPEIVQTHADERLFAKQLVEYKAAVERLAQYQVAVGREEVTEQQPTGEYEVVDGEIAPVEVMQEVVTVTAIAPVEATVTVMVPDENDPLAAAVEQTIENPLITKDNEERAAAQAVVDATPQAVKDAA